LSRCLRHWRLTETCRAPQQKQPESRREKFNVHGLLKQRRNTCIRISTSRGYYKLRARLNFLIGPVTTYNLSMERKIFWIVFMVLGLLADFLLPIWWGLAATIPIAFIAWWVAYRSDWF
jgi:hypothetical protein